MAGMSQRAYARHRGVSHRAVQKAIESGRITVGSDGKIDPATADREWDANTDPSKPSSTVRNLPAAAAPAAPGQPAAPRAPDREPGERPASFSGARAAREVYEAKLKKLAYDRESGLVVNADAVKVGQFTVARAARNALLALEDRVSPLVVGLTEEADVRAILRRELRRVCDELSKPETYRAQTEQGA